MTIRQLQLTWRLPLERAKSDYDLLVCLTWSIQTTDYVVPWRLVIQLLEYEYSYNCNFCDYDKLDFMARNTTKTITATATTFKSASTVRNLTTFTTTAIQLQLYKRLSIRLQKHDCNYNCDHDCQFYDSDVSDADGALINWWLIDIGE
jgi:hypothetical protein